MAATTWQELCRLKKETQTASIPPAWKLQTVPGVEVVDIRHIPSACGILSDLEVEITELDNVDELLRRLAAGIWSSVDVTTAYLKRAMIAHQLTNCLTEFWIDDALKRAAELDISLKTTGVVGPLHGLPISLKDQFQVEGKECNMGIASWIGRISTEDASLVKVLKAAGAIIYVRTNVPQTLMKPETDNHVYGVTVNPRNRRLTPGGSSGGEGALLALKGSPLGVGTDIGGSVRIPSGFCGLYGLRPTMRRVPYTGAANTLLGLEAIESSIGPLARTLEGCATFLRAVANGKPYEVDPKVVEMPWRESQYQLEHLEGRGTKLCFAYFEDDGVLRPTPPVRRAIRTVVDGLRAAGHNVISWVPEDHVGICEIGSAIFASGAADDFAEIMKESGETLIAGLSLPRPPITVHESWKLTQKRDRYRESFLRKWLATADMTGTARPIDGLICPMSACPAPPLESRLFPSYTQAFNVLDAPSVILPVTTVKPEVDLPESGYAPRSDRDAAIYNGYKPELYENGPVAVQVVGRRWREEELLGVCHEVDKVCRSLLSK